MSFDSVGLQFSGRFESSEAAAKQVRQWNGPRTDYPRDRTIAELFEDVAASFPNSIALELGRHQLTYAELNSRANQLARRLRAVGVGPETLVGCCIERSFELIVALVAILKAGGAYVPLDPEYPKERFDFLLADTQAKVVITQPAIAATILSEYGGTCVVVDDFSSPGAATDNLEPLSGPKSLAYVMYTSGSTGRPKGVMVENRSVIRLVRNTNYCHFGASEAFLQFAPISFDASTFEVWGALLNGGRLVIMPPAPTSLKDLIRVTREHKVTTLWLTAGLFNLFVEEDLEGLDSVRQFLAGGDVLSPRHVRLALAKLPRCRVINGYGPTENTTFTCCYSIGAEDPVPQPLPIGSPISNTRVYVLDEEGRPVPPGTAGELFVAGDGVARGYLNAPEITSTKFIPDPFVDEDDDARMYRTGDLARWRSDGVVEFLGRIDEQLKIRGHRVEPGEIEAALDEHDQIAQSCVVAVPDGLGFKRLVAYFVVLHGELSGGSLRDFLVAKLPEFMIPALFVQIAALPLTPNGKVDRSALASRGVAEQDATGAKAADTELEKIIFDVWRRSLGMERFGVLSNFFDLGGNSLLLVSVHASLEKALQVTIPITTLFKFTTIKSLAEHLSGRIPSGQSVADAQARAKRQRAAFAQQRERRNGSLL